MSLYHEGVINLCSALTLLVLGQCIKRLTPPCNLMAIKVQFFSLNFRHDERESSFFILFDWRLLFCFGQSATSFFKNGLSSILLFCNCWSALSINGKRYVHVLCSYSDVKFQHFTCQREDGRILVYIYGYQEFTVGNNRCIVKSSK